jgi:hypothetical protein
VCKENIPKGELRILVEAPQSESMGYSMSHSTHPSCFKLPRKLTTGANKISIEEFVDDFLLDGGDEKTGAFLPDKREEMIAALIEACEKKKMKKGVKDGQESIMARLKAVIKTEEEADKKGEDPPKKKAKTDGNGGDKAEFEAMLPLYRKYHKYNAEALKDFMRWNKQIVSGNKDFILFKVIDGQLHGRLALCPLCQGRLKFKEGDYEKVYCNGRQDPDTYTRETCNYAAPRFGPKATPRFLPFYLGEPVSVGHGTGQRIRGDSSPFGSLITDGRGKGGDGARGRKSERRG